MVPVLVVRVLAQAEREAQTGGPPCPRPPGRPTLAAASPEPFEQFLRRAPIFVALDRASGPSVPSGQNVTCSSNWLGRPLSTVTSSSRPSRNSSTTRVLPIPGSPSSVTRCARLRSCTRSNVSVSSASSRRRSTNGIVERVERGAEPDHRPRGDLAVDLLRDDHARARRTRPRPSRAGASSNPPGPRRGSAACCSRAPMFTSPPITMPRSAAVPTATRPVLMPTCTCIGIGSPSSRPSSGARFTTESAARIARTASSSCEVGTPNTAQHRVADERLRPAAEPFDLLGHHAVERGEHLAEPFGVQAGWPASSNRRDP